MTADGKPINILIVENNAVLRKGLTDLLNYEPDLKVCGNIETVSEALDLLEENTPDLIILDISLNGVSGLDLLKELRRLHRSIPIIVLSMHEESHFVDRAFRDGARGYIIKQDAPESIVAAIHTVVSGDTYLSKSVKFKAPRKGIIQK